MTYIFLEQQPHECQECMEEVQKTAATSNVCDWRERSIEHVSECNGLQQ
jgi:hypothetical protein